MKNDLFPKIKRGINDLITDEEGGIPSGRLLTLGSMILLFTLLIDYGAYAEHKSHQSHKSHSSGKAGNNHYSHQSHQSHQSHVSGSGGSHVNSSHSNSGSDYNIKEDYTPPSDETVYPTEKISYPEPTTKPIGLDSYDVPDLYLNPDSTQYDIDLNDIINLNKEQITGTADILRQAEETSDFTKETGILNPGDME